MQVLRNSGVSKRAKSALFNQYALKQLSCLLSPPSGEQVDGGGKKTGRGEEYFQMITGENGEIVSLTLHEYILQVLTELCTSFQYGVCYRTKIESLMSERYDCGTISRHTQWSPSNQDIIRPGIRCP